MKLSRRVAALKPSPSFAVTAAVRRLRAEGRDIVDLGVGEPDFPVVAVGKAAAHGAIDADKSHYTPSVGLPELREAIAAFHDARHGSGARTEDVVVGAGAKPLLYQLLQAHVEVGDEVVVSSPYWVSFPAQVALAGGTFVAAPADAAEGFVPRASQVERAMSAKTAAVIVNSPCNPSGAVMPQDEVLALVRLCANRGVLLIFDEVYDCLVFDGRHVSPLCFKDEHPGGIACVGAASKTFAMTGWRLGHAIAPGEPSRALARMQDHVTSNPNTLAQAAALAAYTRGWPEAEGLAAELRRRRDLALAGLARVEGASCVPPAGTFFAFPAMDLGTGEEVDSAKLATWILNASGVALVPGAAFGKEGHLRLSFAAAPEAIRVGLERLADGMARLRRDPSLLLRA